MCSTRLDEHADQALVSRWPELDIDDHAFIPALDEGRTFMRAYEALTVASTVVEMEFTNVNPEVFALITGMTPRTVRKLPVEIQAMRWPGGAELATAVINWVLDNGGTARYRERRFAGTRVVEGQIEDYFIEESLSINTLEGVTTAKAGDWILCVFEGEFYTCKPDIFAKTYEVLS